MPIAATGQVIQLADAEAAIAAWLRTYLGTGYKVVTELPSSLADVVAATPVAQVARFGGSSSLLGTDAANIDVDTFDLAHGGSAARENSRAFAEKIRLAFMYTLPGSAVTGGWVSTVAEINAPRWVPYDNTDLRRFVASYRITIRSTEGVPQ